MEVILNQDFPSLGYVGDKVKVRPGYARNFLIPRGVAIEATGRNSSVLKHRLLAINVKKIKLRAEAEEFAKRLSTLKLEFFVRVGSQGKAFGAVTVKDIEAAMQKEGITLDRRQIRLAEPIKKAGSFQVIIKLHSEVQAPVAIQVNAEVPEAQKKLADGEKKTRGKKGAAGTKEGRSTQKKKASEEESSSDGESVESVENNETTAASSETQNTETDTDTE